jgi:hypothetical protein
VRDASFIPVLFLAIAIVTAIVVFSIVQNQRHAKTLERIARRFRGRLEAGNFFTRGKVRLRFLGYPALLKFVQHGKNSFHTVFSITWPEPAFRLEVYPQDILSGFRRLWGMEDIEIGSPEFDRSFYISGNSPAAVRDMLSAEVQKCVWRLAGMGWAPPAYAARDIQVKFLGGVLTVTKPRHLTSFEHLEEFITLSANLFEAATRTRTTGITFLSQPAATGEPPEPDAAESRCQVCGEPLAADLVWCAACKAPHHRECWEYFGGCSTYACGHKQYVTKVKRRKAS